jgi:hypothetical protein
VASISRDLRDVSRGTLTIKFPSHLAYSTERHLQCVGVIGGRLATAMSPAHPSPGFAFTQRILWSIRLRTMQRTNFESLVFRNEGNASPRSYAYRFQSLLCLKGFRAELASAGNCLPVFLAEGFLQKLVGASVTTWKISW